MMIFYRVILFICCFPCILSYFCDVNGADFSYVETMDISLRKRIISSSSCPNHFSICQESRCAGEASTLAEKQELYIEVPLYPVIAQSITDTTCRNGTIAIALNGVPIESISMVKASCGSPGIFGQSSGAKACDLNGDKDGTITCGDAVVAHGGTFDRCGGHADYRGIYHYHTIPVCLLQQLQQQPSSPQIGWALDGFPIYGPIGPERIPMAPCGTPPAHPTICLDECNGLAGELPGYDEYLYRYYMSGETASGQCSDNVINSYACQREDDKCCLSTIPSKVYSPYSIGCYRGCLLDDKDCLIAAAGTSDSFLPAISHHATGIHDPQVTSIEEETSEHFPDIEDVEATRDPFISQPAFTVVRLPSRGLGVWSRDESTLTELPHSNQDSFISAMSINENSTEDDAMLYYTTHQAIYSINADGSGIHVVFIRGYGFGKSINDINSVTVKEVPCSTILHHSDTLLECWTTHIPPDATIANDDVYVSSRFNSMRGVHLQPLTISRSAATRMVLASIESQSVPFLPYALTTTASHLYFSDLASFRIYRSSLTGSDITVVAEGLQRVYGLGAVGDTVFYTDASSKTVGKIASASSNQVTVSSVVNNVMEPRALAIDADRGLMYLTLYDGVVQSMSLTKALLDDASVSMTRVAALSSDSRLDGISYIKNIFDNETFRKQVLFVLDASRSKLLCISVDGMSQSALDLSEGWGASAVQWPRSIAVGKAYNTNVVRVYIGEVLGRIWRIDVNASLDAIEATSLATPVMLVDHSGYGASHELRTMLANHRAERHNNKLTVYSSIID